MHFRVTHIFEDDLIQEYMEWAENDVIASVSLSHDVDKEYLKGNMQYKKAVVMLTSFYFENRLTITDKKHTELPYGVLDSIQKLRGDPQLVVAGKVDCFFRLKSAGHLL